MRDRKMSSGIQRSFCGLSCVFPKSVKKVYSLSNLLNVSFLQSDVCRRCKKRVKTSAFLFVLFAIKNYFCHAITLFLLLILFI